MRTLIGLLCLAVALAVVTPSHALEVAAADANDEPTEVGSKNQYKVWVAKDGWVHLRFQTFDGHENYQGQIQIDGGTIALDPKVAVGEGFTFLPSLTRVTFDFKQKPNKTRDFVFRAMGRGKDTTIHFTLNQSKAEGSVVIPPMYMKERVFVGKNGIHPAKSPFSMHFAG